MREELIQFVMGQMDGVHAEYPCLELAIAPSGELLVRGELGFSIDHDGRTIADTYQIELHIPDDYPGSPPIVYETEEKISDEFEHFMEGGNLCLGAPIEIRQKFARHKTLIGFIKGQVIPYLFSYTYKQEHGDLPYGERDHGDLGLIEYYAEYFGTSAMNALKLLKCLADDFAPPLAPCPCGNGLTLKDCHGPKLEELRPHYHPRLFEHELRSMIDMAQRAGVQIPEDEVMPRRMLKNRQQRQRKKSRKW